jgi:hypothetical protein
MTKLSKVALILGLAGGLAGVSSLSAQRKDDGQDEGGVAGAIRYEKAKQAAADRQDRMESARDRGAGDRDSADRMAPRKAKDARTPSATPRRVPPPERKPQ